MSWLKSLNQNSALLFAGALSLCFVSGLVQADDGRDVLSHRLNLVGAADTASLSGQIIKKPVRALWRTELEGRQVDDQLTKSERVRFRLIGNADYRLDSHLSLNAEVRMDLVSEHIETAFADYESKNGVYLHEAALVYQPMGRWIFKAGAINQEFLEAPLLLGERTFPSLVQEYKFVGTKGRILQFVTQQAIPTTQQLGTRSTGSEPSPRLYTGSVAVTQEVSYHSKLAAHMTYFHFTDLPSQVATDSQVLGNTVLIATPSGDEFRYQFRGWETGGEWQWQFSGQTAFRLVASYIENLAADSDINKGQLIGVGLKLDHWHGVSLQPGISHFINQSDTAPAYYNSWTYGHNNRAGWAYDLKAVWPNKKFRAGLRYVNSRAINETAFQPEQNYFLITLGTDYAEI